jgi:diguanylate cyclase (GGDEF)-like protein
MSVRVNSRPGVAGESVIQSIVEAIRRALRIGDSLYRLSEHSFAILMPETDRHAALSVSDRVRAEMRFLAATLNDEITAVIGLSIGPTDGDTVKSLLAAAERHASLIQPDGHPPSVH